MTIHYKEIQKMIDHLNRVLGFVQFSGLEKSKDVMPYVIGVINTLQDEMDLQIEEILKQHEL